MTDFTGPKTENTEDISASVSSKNIDPMYILLKIAKLGIELGRIEGVWDATDGEMLIAMPAVLRTV